MKLTIFSESSDDEAALRILIEAILNEKIEEVPRQNQLRSRGFSSVLTESPVVIRSAYYQTESEAVVIVCDSDDEPVHNQKHEEVNNEESQRCRLCSLKRKVVETLTTLKPLPHREMIKVAIGVAVPSIEAWYLCGGKLAVGEESWIRKLKGEKVGYDRMSLKTRVYGERPFAGKRAEIVFEEATRLAKNLKLLNERFPEGFGSLINEVKSWKH